LTDKIVIKKKSAVFSQTHSWFFYYKLSWKTIRQRSKFSMSMRDELMERLQRFW